MHLFTYGTLSIPAVMQTVLHRLPTNAAATLNHFECTLLQGAIYPGIFPQTDSVTYGRVFSGIDATELIILDDYEGVEYQRQQLHILSDTKDLNAWVYVIPEKLKHLRTPTTWDEQHFVQHHLESFLPYI